MAGESLEMQQWRLGKEAGLEIQILAGEKVLSRVISHVHSSVHACMSVCVCMYSFTHSFIYLFFIHSLIYLLFIYPSINLIIHSFIHHIFIGIPAQC